MSVLPIFFCGPHCSGKTSILKDLRAEGLISDCGFEIGKELFYQRRIDTATQGEAFEREITQMELARDVEFAGADGVIGIESWHPGNLAYAAVRNPNVVPSLLREMEKSPILPSAFGICFRVSRENVFLRTRTFKDDREWAAEFYTQIGAKLEECLSSLGLSGKCVSLDANRPYADVYADVKAAIKDFAKRKR